MSGERSIVWKCRLEKRLYEIEIRSTSKGVNRKCHKQSREKETRGHVSKVPCAQVVLQCLLFFRAFFLFCLIMAIPFSRWPTLAGSLTRSPIHSPSPSNWNTSTVKPSTDCTSRFYPAFLLLSNCKVIL